MPEDTTTPNTTPAKPQVTATPTPLSSLEFSPFNILIFNREVKIPTDQPDHFEVSNEIMLSIRRQPRSPYDDARSFPLTSIPTLVMMLEEIAKTSMTVTSLRPQTPPAPTTSAAAAAVKQRQPRPQRKKSRR